MTDTDSILHGAHLLVVGSATWLETVTETLETRTEATVCTVETATDAITTVQQEPIDCLITEYTLGETTGIELVRQLQEVAWTVPVVLGTADGSEQIASDAIGAGISDYIAIPETDDQLGEEIIQRIEQAVRSARRTITERERARQFDAIFHDSQTATWVLDPDGTLARVNRTAREMIDADIDAIIGEAFWTLPWWSQSTEADIRHLVRKASDGTFANGVIFQPKATQRIIDLSIRPVENEVGDLVSIIVEGIDITEQVRLERELRESEKLHRVTLNNMTDTILITDEAGEYTYVCPNVHFIFGYTAEEIHRQGDIEALLGEDLFDREELAKDGVLKNIECTVTDKAGREHTLLVNVREVSIQDGTLLYSCRDITKRKQRDEALTTLQETARAFLYAETNQEIAEHIVDDVPSVLGLPASAIYLFDDDANELRPAAYSQAMTNFHGPLPTVHADGETVPSYSFVNDEVLVFDDVHTAKRLDNYATDLRSAMYIPLGNHGVFVVGSTDVGVFDGMRRELADLLAASTEAALDRVARETKLREQDRELQRQNNQLASLNQINETIREIDQAIVGAETTDEIDHTVCERLTDSNRFKFAWIGSVDPTTSTVEPRAQAGAGQGYLDGQSIDVAPTAVEPAGQTASTGEITAVPSVATDLRNAPWRSEALARDFLSVLSIPLVYNGLSHGVLTVYADTKNAFDEMTRAVLQELGETIASARSAIERKHALLTASMTRVEFTIEETTFPLSQLARTAACTLSYDGGVQHSAAGDSVFVTVEEGDVQTVAAAAAEMATIDGVTQMSEGETGNGVLRLELSQPFLALELADHGAIFREATADPTTTSLIVDVPESVDVRAIAQLVRETFPTAELQRKETVDGGTDYTIYSEFPANLTDRQQEVIQTAYYGGYFESPRENSGEAIAETLGISPPAFYQHVRAVERKLFATLFEEYSASQGQPPEGFNY